MKCTDGKTFDGRLKEGQVWVKGNIERKIVSFDSLYMTYQTKENIKKGTLTVRSRFAFRRWLFSGAMLKV